MQITIHTSVWRLRRYVLSKAIWRRETESGRICVAHVCVFGLYLRVKEEICLLHCLNLSILDIRFVLHMRACLKDMEKHWSCPSQRHNRSVKFQAFMLQVCCTSVKLRLSHKRLLWSWFEGLDYSHLKPTWLPTFLNMFSFGGDVDVVVLKALSAENLFTLIVAAFKSNDLETALTQFHWLKSTSTNV